MDFKLVLSRLLTAFDEEGIGYVLKVCDFPSLH